MPLSAVDDQPRDAERAVLYRVIDERLGAFLETLRGARGGAHQVLGALAGSCALPAREPAWGVGL